MKNCCECQSEIGDSDDFDWSSTKEDYLCMACRESDSSSLSVVHLIDDGVVKKYYIGDHIRMDEDGDDISELNIKREWVSSSAHRGHYETKIDGWAEVLVGWTTGSWGDGTSERKQIFNQWAQDIIAGNIIPPAPIAIVSDPTSNLFSTGVSVLTQHVQMFNDWVEEIQEELSNSLS